MNGEERLRELLRLAPEGSDVSGNAHRAFSELLCAGRCAEAFGLAEALLDRAGRMPLPAALQWPWWSARSRGSVDDRFRRGELRRLARAPEDPAYPHWRAYCRAVLLLGLGRRQEALFELPIIERTDPARYDFMRHPFVVLKLDQEEDSADWVLRAGRPLLRRAPGIWELRCRMAEALLSLGRTGEGLREFGRAARSCGPDDVPAVWAWHGEALLWLGRWRASLERLDAALGAGAAPFARTWRGAALLLAGGVQEALREFDAISASGLSDPEIHVWRGEALLRAGRFHEALSDYGRAILAGFHWGRYGRALAHIASGDLRSARADASAIPSPEKEFLRARLHMSREEAETPSGLRTLLETGLLRARGVRRSELFLRRIWMR